MKQQGQIAAIFFYPVQLVGVFRSSAIGEDERSESATAGGLYIW